VAYCAGQRDSYRHAAEFSRAPIPVICLSSSRQSFSLSSTLRLPRALGIDIPSTLLATADEVIELGILFVAVHESPNGTFRTCRVG
jgi:hypothetical protein